jgi:poly(A) polymerase
MPELEETQQRHLGRMVAVYPVADELARRFDDAGHELYLVGGTVRDTLLAGRAGRSHQDLDFATSASPEDSEAVLRGWADHIWLTGARFGTVSAAKDGWPLEITTYRSDRYTAGSRHPDVTFGEDIEADLSRRDFTMNAMAVRLPEVRFLDPFGGLPDLRAKVLRTPVEPETSFGDDPLRMVRLCRFAAKLGARPDEAAAKAATTMAGQLTTISAERVRDELCKLVTSRYAAIGLDLLCETGLADIVLPELPALRMERDPLHHHKDVYTHTLAVVEGCPPEDLTLRVAALLHDIGKPATREFAPGGKVTFHHHEVVGARMARARMRSLRFPNRMTDDVCALIYLHLRFHGYSGDGWTDSAVRRYVRDAGSDEQLRRLNLLTRADVTTQNKRKARRLASAVDDLEERIERLAEAEEIAAIRPALDGNQIMSHLGLPPGPDVGRARQHLLDRRLDDGPMTEDEAYALLDRWAHEQGLPQD